MNPISSMFFPMRPVEDIALDPAAQTSPHARFSRGSR
jgi:hypothetical protein